MYKVIAVNREFEEEKNKPKYMYETLNQYACHNIYSSDKEIEKEYKDELLESRFHISLEDFKNKCEEAFKNYERTFDEYDTDTNDIDYEDEDYEDEEW
jgi:hypothetical protein